MTERDRPTPDTPHYFLAEFQTHVIMGKVLRFDLDRLDDTIEGLGRSEGETLQRWTSGTADDIARHTITKAVIDRGLPLEDIVRLCNAAYPAQSRVGL